MNSRISKNKKNPQWENQIIITSYGWVIASGPGVWYLGSEFTEIILLKMFICHIISFTQYIHRTADKY